METRPVTAYALIGIMVALAIFGAVRLSQKRTRAHRRDSGHGPHMNSRQNSKDKRDEHA